jgi:hypothetical protein
VTAPAWEGPRLWLHGDLHPANVLIADAATLRRARGWAVLQAIGGILIGEAGVHGRPGGKPTWGPPARASLERLIATGRPHGAAGRRVRPRCG